MGCFEWRIRYGINPAAEIKAVNAKAAAAYNWFLLMHGVDGKIPCKKCGQIENDCSENVKQIRDGIWHISCCCTDCKGKFTIFYDDERELAIYET